MGNGDKCNIPNADQLFEFIACSKEAFAEVDKGTPAWKKSEPDLFTIELDESFMTINRDSISHITWVK